MVSGLKDSYSCACWALAAVESTSEVEGGPWQDRGTKGILGEREAKTRLWRCFVAMPGGWVLAHGLSGLWGPEWGHPWSSEGSVPRGLA